MYLCLLINKTLGGYFVHYNSPSTNIEIKVMKNGRSYSILKKQIISLLNINKDEINKLWKYFDLIELSVLALNNKDWEELKKIALRKNDSLSCVIPITLGYLITTNISKKGFNEILRILKYYTNRFLNNENKKTKELDLSEDALLNKEELELIKILDKQLFYSLLALPKVKNSSNINKVINEKSIIEFYGYSLLAFRMISKVREYKAKAEEMLSKGYNPFNYSNLQEMLSAYLGEISISKRDQMILFTRYGYPDNDTMTYEDIGILFEITRERVRQIIKRIVRKLTHPSRTTHCSKSKFYVLKKLTDYFIKKNFNSVTLSSVNEYYVSEFNWSEKPGTLLIILLGILLNYKLFSENNNSINLIKDYFELPKNNISLDKIFIAKKSVCQNCTKIIRATDIDIGNLYNGKYFCVKLEEFLNTVRNKCYDICKGPGIPKHLLKIKLKDSKNFFYSKGYVFNKEAWDISKGTFQKSIEAFLKVYKKPLHYKELEDKAKQYNIESLLKERKNTNHSIHSVMNRSRYLLLWDRGTFIHKDNIQLPDDLLSKISKWIKLKLSENIPYLSVAGVFKEFKFECKKNNVPTESSLYSLLREYNHECLDFPKYPKITLKRSSYKKILPLNIIMEDFIKSQGTVVSNKELKEYIIDTLLYKEFQFQQAKSNLNKVLFTKNKGLIHYSNLNLNADKLKELTKYIKELLNNIGHVSIQRIFKEKQVTCYEIGVTSARMLYSLLKNEYNFFDYPRFPIITINTQKANDTIKTLGKYVLKYIKNKEDYCTFSELEEEFVKKRGYRWYSVRNTLNSDKLLRYTSSSIVHKEKIGWDEAKNNSLINLAKNEYLKKEKLNKKYVSIEQFISTEKLPKLKNDLVWTETLLGEILEHSGIFKLIGTKSQFYFKYPNKFGIRNLPDLIKELLHEVFQGAANLDEFNNYLCELKLIGNTLPKCIFEDNSIFYDQSRNLIKLVN